MLPKLRTLVLASFFGKLVYALSSLAVLPIMTWMLGQESVGLLGFFTSLLMVFMALDGGLTSSVTREMAGLSSLKHRSLRRYRIHAISVTNTYMLLFLAIGVFVSATIALSADFLATSWLKVEDLELSKVRLAIFGMAIFIGLNFPVMILQAALHGREMQVELNLLYVPYAILRTLGVLGVLYLLGDSASIELYFMFQAVLQLLYLFCLMLIFYGGQMAANWQVSPSLRFLRRGFVFGSGVLMISLTSVVVVQIDKLYLSGHLSLENYAVYALAGTFASIPYIFSSALYAAIFPRFSVYNSENQMPRLAGVFHSAFCGFTIILTSICMAAWFFSDYPLRLIFDKALAEEVAGIMPILLTGTALQALLIVPFALQLAVGWTSLTLRLNLLSIPIILLVLPRAVDDYGAAGAAWVWLFYNIIAFIITLYFVVIRFPFLRRSLKGIVRAAVFLIFLLLPAFLALEWWIFPNLSDVLVVISLFGLGVFSVAIAGWCFRKDLFGIV